MNHYKETISSEEFDGRLTDEELRYLKSNAMCQNQINYISKFVAENSKYLSGYQDLVGDDLIPGKLFPFITKHFGFLLQTEPKDVLSPLGIALRKALIRPLIKSLGPCFLHSSIQLENRNELLGKLNPRTGAPLIDAGISLPKEPVIWTMNHHFKDDVLAAAIAAKRHAYLFLGSVPQFFNTFDGILAYLVGTILTNRKNSISKASASAKAIYLLRHHVDLLIAPEGVWCKYPNELLLNLWSGFYRIANETGAKVVPIIEYIADPSQKAKKTDNPIHIVIDDPIDLTNLKGLSEHAALEYYRDVMATWYFLMMEKYGQTTRDVVVSPYTTSKEAWEAYLKECLKTVERYDSQIECAAHRNTKPQSADVWDAVAKINITPYNARDVVCARKLTAILREEDFQKRF